MSLISLSYSEYKNKEKHWEICNASFSKINLIVGKNTSGKSRLMSVINSLARIITGNHKVLESCIFSVKIELEHREYSYEIKFENGNVIKEKLKIDKVIKLLRKKNGEGKIFYQKEEKFFEFKIPLDVVAVVNRRDEIQHPFLVDLYQWASGVVKYSFGSDFGRSHVMNMAEAQAIYENNITPIFDDPDDLVRIYTTAFKNFGDNFDNAIITDMNKLGYSLKEVGCDNLQNIIRFPVSVLALFTVEKELGFKIPQMHMSQGMFRALALVIHLNVCAFTKSKKLILVDDIGEGLDYERSVAIIDLLTSKVLENNMQLIMTSNDRFVMNKVPLEYWSVLKRDGGIVKMYNSKNSQKKFEQFKYMGLNNFDFFASEFFEAETENE
jgi:ABC-type lipoprotein export system ATPase subunit